MGYVSTIVLEHNNLHIIRDNPGRFVEALLHQVSNPDEKPSRISLDGHTLATFVERHHTETHSLLLVGSYPRVLGRTGERLCHDEVEVIKEMLAENNLHICHIRGY